MGLTNIQKMPGESNTSYAYRVLKANIMNFNLIPGDIIKKDELSEVLSISPTPFREAVLKLREDTLIDVYAQSKSCVSKIDCKLAKEGVFVRSLVETRISQLLCGNLSEAMLCLLDENLRQQERVAEGYQIGRSFLEIDNEFHEYLYKFSDMVWTWEMLQRSCIHLNRIRHFNDLYGSKRMITLFKAHKDIFEYLKGHKTEPIKELILRHFTNPIQKGSQETLFLNILLEQYPAYFCNVNSLF